MPKAAASQTGDRAVVDKAFRLLFGLQINGDAGTGVSALARQTELSKTTAHRLLGMLERNGAVDRVGTAYRVGLALKRLARPAEDVRIEQMRDAIIPFMTDLHVATGAAVHLAVVENDRTLFLNRIYGHN
ncbi:MAG: helix-turn-helix domain-containing protein, partial [Propionibacteriaceae bacterium]|nr:helix-turn-helix domain-containing protein [Propionibacteriaceae bacterium]